MSASTANKPNVEQWMRFDPISLGLPAGCSGVLLVDLKAVRGNYRKLRQMAPMAETAAVVKADAYGLGAAKIVPALENEGCGTFFVATIAEAAVVRELSSRARIFVLDGLFPCSEEALKAMGARPVLGSLPEIEQWSAFTRREGSPIPAALHIDTGMNRLGLTEADFQEIVAQSDRIAAFQSCLLMSHLACGDDRAHPKNNEQLARFELLSAALPGIPRSLASSAGIFLSQSFYFDVTRPGIAIYGGRAQDTGPNPMQPVVWLYGRIVQVRWVERGDTIGYGAAQTLKRRTRIATVSVGYADGFFRGVSASDLHEGPSAFIAGHRLPLLGRVSMDLTTFDATDVPEHLVQRGGWVELLGQRVTIDDLAAFAGTIGYEVLTALGHRYRRVYFDNDGSLGDEAVRKSDG